MKQDKQLEVIQEQLNSDNAEVRLEAVNQLNHYKRSEPAHFILSILNQVLLHDKSAEVKQEAISAIINFSINNVREVKHTIDGLLHSLQCSHDEVRELAAMALGDVEKACRTKEPRILHALVETLQHDTHPDVRSEAAAAIPSFGHQASIAIPTLCHALATEDELDARRAAIDALSKLHQRGVKQNNITTQPLLKLISSYDNVIQLSSMIALSHAIEGNEGEMAELIPLYQEYLCESEKEEDAEDASYVEDIATFLVKVSHHDDRALEALLQPYALCTNKTRWFYQKPWRTLGQKAVPGLLALFRNSSFEGRSNAAIALAWIGKEAIDAIPELCEFTQQHPSSDLAYYSVQAIQHIIAQERTKASLVIPALLQVLQESFSNEAKNHAADTIALFNSDAKAAVPALIKATQSEYTRGSAYWALGRIAPDEKKVKKLLRKALTSSQDYFERLHIVESLQRTSEVAIPLWVQAFRHLDEEAKSFVLGALGEMGEKAKEAIPFLLKVAQKDNSSSIRQEALETLFLLNKYTKDYVPVLQKSIQPFFSQDEDTSMLKQLLKQVTSTLFAATTTKDSQETDIFFVEEVVSILGGTQEGHAVLLEIYPQTLLYPSLRSKTLLALCELPQEPAHIAKLVSDALKENDSDSLHWSALCGAENLGPAAEIVAPQLITQFCFDKQQTVGEKHRKVANLLGQIESPAPEALEVLTRWLSSQVENLRRASLLSLCQLNQPIHSHVPVVLEAVGYFLAQCEEYEARALDGEELSELMLDNLHGLTVLCNACSQMVRASQTKELGTQAISKKILDYVLDLETSLSVLLVSQQGKTNEVLHTVKTALETLMLTLQMT